MPAVSTFFKFFTTVHHPVGTNGLLIALYFVTPDLFQQVLGIIVNFVLKIFETGKGEIFLQYDIIVAFLLHFLVP